MHECFQDLMSVNLHTDNNGDVSAHFTTSSPSAQFL